MRNAPLNTNDLFPYAVNPVKAFVESRSIYLRSSTFEDWHKRQQEEDMI